MTCHVEQALQQLFGGHCSVQGLHASSFCDTWRAQCGGRTLFVKTAGLAGAEVLAAEADGLQALAATGTVRVPEVVASAGTGDAGLAVLALEWLDLHAPDADFGARLGEALGALHCASASRRYGWPRDNWLGGTPQRNTWHDDWPGFFAHHRIGALRSRLAEHGSGRALPEALDALLPRIAGFFDDGHRPRPSLVHGDLWAGNWGMLADGTPVVYDPAVSCSDAEAELAMMELFGTPPPGFWPAYRGIAGLHAGYGRRRGLYQLYHLLNHALLFGGSYVDRSLRLVRSLLGAA